METEIPVETPRPPTTPKSRIPPIILRDGQRWSEISRRMTENSIRYSKAKTTPEGVRIQPVEVSDFRSLVRLLDSLKVPYHPFTLPEEKNRPRCHPWHRHRRCQLGGAGRTGVPRAPSHPGQSDEPMGLPDAPRPRRAAYVHKGRDLRGENPLRLLRQG